MELGSRPYLVVVRAGDRSLHPQWLGGQGRNWDLIVSAYGSRPERYVDQYDGLHQFKGSKWEGLHHFAQSQAALIARYRSVWFPDDDLLVTGEQINNFFAVSDQLGWAITQPALTPYSHVSWAITRQDPSCMARETNFVEIMAPCFRADALPRFLPTFGESVSGWGLEWIWSQMAQAAEPAMKMGIIDCTPVYHTRPVGSAGHGGAQLNPHIEMRQLLQKHGVARSSPTVLARLVRAAATGAAPLA